MKFFLFVLLLFQTSFAGTLEDYFKGIKTLHVVFVQRMKLPVAGDEVSLYRGEIFYKRPLKFLWKYTWGSRAFVLSNGNLLETYLDDGECQITSVKDNLSLFPLLKIIESPDLLTKEYHVLYKHEGSVKTFILKPKDKNTYFRKIELLFRNKKLEEVITVQKDGTQQTYFIKKFEKNVPINGQVFRLKECKGLARSQP